LLWLKVKLTGLTTARINQEKMLIKDEHEPTGPILEPLWLSLMKMSKELDKLGMD